MSQLQWFVYPLENGFELIIDSVEDEVYEAALAEFVAAYPDVNLATEWITDGGGVMHFVPAPVDAPVPAPRSEAEQRSRAAHPAGKGRRIPRQDS